MSASDFHELQNVFGVSRRIPLTYVSRSYVDDVFAESIKRHKHVVVYGGSKQGKTSLRKNCLPEDHSIIVQCANATTRERLYELVLKQAGAKIDLTSTQTSTGSNKLGVQFSAEGKFAFFAKAGGTANGERARTSTVQTSHREFEIDPSDVNDVIRVLNGIGFKKFIVLEDFHYLAEDVQKEVAVDLKAFHEQTDISFVIIGVWLETNRLVLYNGDLAGRLVSINADRWDHTDLERVISEGEPLLNVVFNHSAKRSIVQQCQDNVGLLQEICHEICTSSGVSHTQEDLRTVGSEGEVLETIERITKENAGRYHSFLREFAHGFQTTELDMYRWIAYAVITANDRDLRRGLKLPWIHRTIENVHPKTGGVLHRNNVLQALSNVRRLQHKKNVRPMVLDFDTSSNVLTVVDIGFILYLNSEIRSDLLNLVECADVVPQRLEPERRTRRRRADDLS